MRRLFTAAVVLLCLALPSHAADCKLALKTIFKNEGAYQCLKADSGNWTGGKVGVGKLKGTKYGIAAASYPKENIKALTLEKAALYYERDYFIPLKQQNVKSQGLATVHLDTAVNCGTGATAILMNRTRNFLQYGDMNLPTDPYVTNDDIKWLNKYTQNKSQRRLYYLVFQALRTERYVAITKADKRKRRFLETWLLRTWE